MAQVNAGRVRFIGRGEYNNSTQYYTFDLVEYNGNSYFAKSNTIGNLPVDSTHWQLIAEKGKTGNDGPTGPAGNGIDHISLTSQSGATKTYTIYYTDGTTYDYNVTDGEVTQEVFDEEIDRLKMVYNALPSEEATGENITIDGTAEVPFREIGLKGNTSQDGEPTPDTPIPVNVVSGDNTIGICGKNQYDITFRDKGVVKSSNCTTIVDNDKYKSTATGTDMYIWGVDYTVGNPYDTGKGKLYKFYSNNYVCTITNSSMSKNFVTYYDSNKKVVGAKQVNSTTIPISKSDKTGAEYFTLRIGNGSATVGTTYEYGVMLEKGSTATTYEPYTGNTYPISLGTENLWKNQLTGFLPQTGDYPTTNSSYPNARYVLVPLLKGQSITLSGSTSSSGRVRCIDKGTNLCVGNISTATSSYYIATNNANTQFNDPTTITAKKDIILGILDLTNNINDLIVNYGTTAQYISENPIELCKIGDYQDYIYKSNNKWYVEKQIGKVVLNGSENWTRFGVFGDAYLFYVDNLTYGLVPASQEVLIPGLSNYFSWAKTVKNTEPAPYIRFQYSSGKRLYLGFKNDMTLDDFKAWLSAHNTEVYYVLETPTTTEITDTTLINQLNNLEKAYSYDEQTNINQVNNDLPFIITTEAILSLKNILNI